jgi:flavin reductase (DIM6/NTAB) family NADH-FMN oxidoreductase RutF
MDPKAFYRVTYGLYIVSSQKDGRNNGQIANSIFQVTSTPPTVAISINKQNLTHEYIETSRVLAISILAQDTPLPFIGSFGFKSGRTTDKFQGLNFKMGSNGAPIVLDNALAAIEGKVIQAVDCGTHTIFIAEVSDAAVLKEGEPMTYAYYQQVKRGTTPKTAPSYIAPAK